MSRNQCVKTVIGQKSPPIILDFYMQNFSEISWRFPQFKMEAWLVESPITQVVFHPPQRVVYRVVWRPEDMPAFPLPVLILVDRRDEQHAAQIPTSVQPRRHEH